MSDRKIVRMRADQVPDGSQVKCGVLEGILRQGKDQVTRIYFGLDPKLHAAIASSELIEVFTEGESDAVQAQG